jgi:hypothetical protein
VAPLSSEAHDGAQAPREGAPERMSSSPPASEASRPALLLPASSSAWKSPLLGCPLLSADDIRLQGGAEGGGEASGVGVK